MDQSVSTKPTSKSAANGDTYTEPSTNTEIPSIVGFHAELSRFFHRENSTFEPRYLVGGLPFQLPRNQGPSVAAKNNFREARGEFICALASDNLFHKEKLERQVAFLCANPEIGVAFSYMRYVNEVGDEIKNHTGYKWVEVDNCSREIWLRRFFKVGNNLSAPTAMIRRGVFSKIGLTDPRLLQTQDLDLWIRICPDFEVHVMPERLIDYRIRGNELNTSASTPYKQVQVHWELAKVFESYATIEDRDFFAGFFPKRGSRDMKTGLSRQSWQNSP